MLSVSPGLQFHSPDGRIIHRFGGQGSSDAERVSRETAYAASAYCFAAIRYRAKKLAEAPLTIVKEDKAANSKEVLLDHILADLLDEPSPDYDMGELLFRTQCYQDITGSALWVKEMDRGGRPGRLTPYAGSEFQIETANGRIRGLYRVDTADGPLELPPERVVYFHEINPHDWHQGLSLVDVALSWLNLGQTTRAMATDILRNALWPSVVIQTDKDWKPTKDDPAWHLYQDQLKAHASRNKRGEPLVLTGGGSATTVTPSLRDLVPHEILNRVEAVVSSVFSIPAIVLQFEVGMENAPWSQMGEAREMTEHDTIQPMRREVEKRLTKQLLNAPPDEGRAPLDPDRDTFVRFDVSDIRALQDDLEAQSRIQMNLRDIATEDERRAIVGLEPLGREPEPPDSPARDPNAGEAGDEEVDPPDTAALDRLFDRKARHVPQASTHWYEFDLTAKAQERTWAPKVAQVLARQSKDIEALFRQFVRESGGQLDEASLGAFLGEVGQYLSVEGKEAASRVLEPLVRSTAETAARRITGRLGISYDVVQAGIERYATEETEFLVSVMGETTGRGVARSVQAAIEDRVPMSELRSRLQELPEFDRKRAQLVARTETTRATNGAQRRTATEYQTETGNRMEKTWISSRDSRVRDEHDLLDDGEWYPIDHDFPGVGTEPGEPNCRCTLGYRIAEEA